jgi:ribosomal protein S30
MPLNKIECRKHHLSVKKKRNAKNYSKRVIEVKMTHRLKQSENRTNQKLQADAVLDK